MTEPAEPTRAIGPIEDGRAAPFLDDGDPTMAEDDDGVTEGFERRRRRGGVPAPTPARRLLRDPGACGEAVRGDFDAFVLGIAGKQTLRESLNIALRPIGTP